LWLVVLFAATLSAAPRVSAAEPQWIEIQSPHFSVITDAGEKRGREVAMRFEQMRAVFGALMTKANVNIPIPLQIVAFRNTKELRQIAPLWHGKPIQLAGLFEPGQDRSFIMLDMSVENPWTVVFHEYAHQLMNGVLTAEVDPWFEEGFAEYFSSIEVDSKEARVGKIPSEEYEILQQQGMMKIADLFKIQHNSSTYNENGGRRTVFYAESGMLAHYLYDNNLIPKLATYFTLKIDKNMPVEDAIQQSFGMSASQFDKELRNYVSGNRYRYYPIPNPPNIVSKDYAMKPLRSTDAKAVVADIHLHSPDYHEKAVDEFQEILKEEPNNAAACRGLGYAYLQKQDFGRAGEYFKRAAQGDSKDPRVHYYSALLMSNEGPLAGNSELPQMTKELEAAIVLDPSFADAYALLAFARMRAGDRPGALSMMLRAVSLSPRNENYRFNLSQMYLNNQQPEKAIAILEILRKSSDQQVALRAGELLRSVQEFQASTRAVHTVNPLPTRVIADRASMSGSVPAEATSTEGANSEMIPSQAPIKFIKGTVQSVDCSAPPSATLRVVSEGKTWMMRIPDSKHALVLGAAEFSCDWNKQKVSLNYRETNNAAGTVVSVEVQ
jgi:tetratricopeptide (TPR) repeat protein